MDFVNYVYLAGTFSRYVLELLLEFTYLINSAVSSPVDLDHIGTRPGANLLTVLAGVSRRRRRALPAVEGLSEDAGGGSLPHAPGPAEAVGVGDSAIGYCVFQRLRNMVLANDVFKILGTPRAG